MHPGADPPGTRGVSGGEFGLQCLFQTPGFGVTRRSFKEHDAGTGGLIAIEFTAKVTAVSQDSKGLLRRKIFCITLRHFKGHVEREGFSDYEHEVVTSGDLMQK